ncbi:MAG: hypothetical protein HOI53_07280 [Francisellaceae bacterium]|nr:hypothetical protein [Francisellaceae bacterium]MBT6207815.1 hypothetical protein [Francisellaceae bacterium]MBT6539396.1 hypothetical protein [Francisellaceae bacterium]
MKITLGSIARIISANDNSFAAASAPLLPYYTLLQSRQSVLTNKPNNVIAFPSKKLLNN